SLTAAASASARVALRGPVTVCQTFLTPPYPYALHTQAPLPVSDGTAPDMGALLCTVVLCAAAWCLVLAALSVGTMMVATTGTRQMAAIATLLSIVSPCLLRSARRAVRAGHHCMDLRR